MRCALRIALLRISESSVCHERLMNKKVKGFYFDVVMPLVITGVSIEKSTGRGGARNKLT